MITAELVRRLLASQFPQWADLPIRTVEHDGWDNRTFRLGESMSVRLPSADWYVPQVDKEQRWLPVLAPHLPVQIPVPLARGQPSPEFDRPWSVYRWIDGDVATAQRVPDMVAFAGELARFLTALYGCQPSGPPPGAHSFARGGPVSTWDAQVRDLIARLDGLIDRRSAFDVWDAATAWPTAGRRVWVHGDVSGSNLLVRDGQLAGVIDFGCSAVGDPACDLTVAWTFFVGDSRRALKASLPVEPSAWARARGWALWKALLHLGEDLTEPGRSHAADRRVGWRIGAQQIIRELIEDLDADEP